MKKLLCASLLFLTCVVLPSVDIDHRYFYEQGIKPCDIQILEKWLELGCHRDAIGHLILQSPQDFQDRITGDFIENKIEHWDYNLRTDLSLPSLMKVYDYQPLIFILSDLNRVDELCVKIKKHSKLSAYDSRKLLHKLDEYRKKIVGLFLYAIKIGVDINAYDASGTTVLIEAIHYHKYEFVKLCLHAGADVNYVGKNNTSQTPCMHAIRALHIESFENSSILDLQSGVFDNGIEIFRTLVHAGANLSRHNSSYQGALDYIHMLQSSLDEVVDYSVQRFAYLSIIDDDVFGSSDSKRFDLNAFKQHARKKYAELYAYLQAKMS